MADLRNGRTGLAWATRQVLGVGGNGLDDASKKRVRSQERHNQNFVSAEVRDLAEAGTGRKAILKLAQVERLRVEVV